MPNHEALAQLLGAGEQIFDLICEGATTGQLAEWLWAPLKHAATAGVLDLTIRLLGAGASESVLSWDVRGGHLEHVGDLLRREAGACLDQRDGNGARDIHIAAWDCHVVIVNVLLLKAPTRRPRVIVALTISRAISFGGQARSRVGGGGSLGCRRTLANVPVTGARIMVVTSTLRWTWPCFTDTRTL